ncbi:MAG: transglutaminase domain-containing protein [Cytophagales bacterium]|nr:hypothetical protein [Bernardetiaceae bacterium]MDW8205547.1 transglutaminase domain-containing protein [Cytophagales bacterium]
MKRSKYFLLATAACLWSIASAQTHDWQQWCHSIKQQFPDEQKRAYAIYHWITRNIRYDWEAFYAAQPTDQSPTAVLQSGKALCEGFATLFHSFASQAGLRCHKVIGISKGVHYQPGSPLNIPDHVWNVVHIHGKWQLVDVTWGAGDGIHQQPNDTYFMIAPEMLIFTHFPEEERWQLLEKPLTLYQFERKPITYPLFTELRPELLYNARELIIPTSCDSVELRLRTSPEAILIAALTDAHQQKRIIKEGIGNRLGIVNIRINGLQRGQSYRLDIFAAADSRSRELRQLLTYFIAYDSKMKYTTQPNSHLRPDSLTQMPTGFVMNYIMLQQQKDYVGALDLLYEYMPRYSKNVWLQTSIGENLEKIGRIEEAERAYLQAIQLQHNNYRANYALGTLYYNRAFQVKESFSSMKPEAQQANADQMMHQIRQWLTKAKPYLQTAYQQRPDNEKLAQVIKQIQQILK